jgi:hypothetical protein
MGAPKKWTLADLDWRQVATLAADTRSERQLAGRVQQTSGSPRSSFQRRLKEALEDWRERKHFGSS